jgi:hypothetical protein
VGAAVVAAFFLPFVVVQEVVESAAARRQIAKTGGMSVFKRESGDGSNGTVPQVKKNLKTCNSKKKRLLNI